MNHLSNAERSRTCPLVPACPRKEGVCFWRVETLTPHLGERLFQPKSGFDLSDPCRHRLNPEYSSLHDPHVKHYLHRKTSTKTLWLEGSSTRMMKSYVRYGSSTRIRNT